MKNKTFIKQVSKHPYILARVKSDNSLAGLSTALLSTKVGQALNDHFSNHESPFVGFITCSFNEYISHKFGYTFMRYQEHIKRFKI